jgi:AcrR family transcriptional regulator
MGRRSDHSREELRELIVSAGHALMGEVGFAAFSAREVAKRIGYSVGTLYNVFGSYDALIVAINTRTFTLWATHLRQGLAGAGTDRIRALVECYFSFARENRNLWMAIYDHRLPAGMTIDDEEAAIRGELTEIVVHEVSEVLPEDQPPRALRLARSLIATVHGHCTFALNGTFEIMGEAEPLEMAVERVKESLAAAGRSSG